MFENIVAALMVILLLSIVVEFLVERVKNLVQITEIGKVKLVPFYAIIISALIAFATQVDLLAIMELHTIPAIGISLTALAISGGSVPVHEMFAKLRESRKVDG